jgi:DNA-binding CsgD family transcriptional regulator
VSKEFYEHLSALVCPQPGVQPPCVDAATRRAHKRVAVVLQRWTVKFGLTDVELTMLKHVVLGTPRGELADVRKVVPDTVRSQVTVLLKKTHKDYPSAKRIGGDGLIAYLLREALREP